MICRNSVLAFAAAIGLAGCIDVPADAVVTDYNGASVHVQVSGLADHDVALAAAQAEAQRICGQAGKHRVEYASERGLPDYMSEMLFTCT